MTIPAEISIKKANNPNTNKFGIKNALAAVFLSLVLFVMLSYYKNKNKSLEV